MNGLGDCRGCLGTLGFGVGAGLKEASDVWGLMKPYFCSFQRANMRKQRKPRDSRSVREDRVQDDLK